MTLYPKIGFVLSFSMASLSVPACLRGAETDPAGTRPLQVSAAGSPGGACSASLPDGRSFVTGGSRAREALASSGFFNKDGQLAPAAPMLEARNRHVCVAFDDGRVLVAGGETGKAGATNSAEIFHPDANTWTATGSMLTARTGAAAVLLKNGTVLVAGGEVDGQAANTLEIYDPGVPSGPGRFDQVPGILSAPRARHALAVLDDGRVVVAGGLEGRQLLDSIDIFDPAQNRVQPAGHMSVARANFTATALADGKVLFVGGGVTSGPGQRGELASAEVYDPATGTSTPTEPLAAARQGHLAIRIAGSDRVLIAAGTARGRMVESAEYFVASRNAFEPAPEAAASAADDAGVTITIGLLGPEGTVRMEKSYRTARPAPR